MFNHSANPGREFELELPRTNPASRFVINNDQQESKQGFMDFITLSQMIFLTSFWSSFSHENGSTECASFHVTGKQKRTSEILFSGFWVLLIDLTVIL